MLTIDLSNKETKFDSKLITTPFNSKYVKVRVEYPGGGAVTCRLPLAENPLTETRIGNIKDKPDVDFRFTYTPESGDQAWEIKTVVDHPQFKDISDFVYNL